ncbi:MBL fold metallo-hydrolase [Aestuariirhabdus litorea]|uniref:MBL fold metallo-hydrolase n=1 Tax=Aestuariirhabdus litorea TaxID=2528527 RepID=A0A3P3VR85_9GAMM|nr:MBL fold metallo-hydrolase [Aestuariirhabdus litorea]RRJ84186.1 MBL fold metallo-hydrolase [Aestuariirhabdus litorea]RWW97407.1 MBL fold metallo-hydrolase [Endozoicomonadaceae bacterium GTF-13]
MQFSSIGSGSKGNGTLIRSGETLLLIDCGFSLKETLARLAAKGVSPEQLDAIFVTHEHGDHINGVAALARRYQIPVYLSAGTRYVGKLSKVAQLQTIADASPVVVGEIEVLPVAVPHDAREPLQYLFHSGGLCIGVLTDLGCITRHVVDHYQQCDGLLLECNHDPYLLSTGPYPPSLKGRVGGNYGHLSNQQAAELLRLVDRERLQRLVVAHISEQNNARERVLEQLLPEVDAERLVFADQGQGFDWITLKEAGMARCDNTLFGTLSLGGN